MEETNVLKLNNYISGVQKKGKGQVKKSSKNLKKSIYQSYNLNKIGSIKFVKIHQSANRPLCKNKDRDLDEADFCKCCNFPIEQEGILEKFNFCDDPDNFVECGEGVSLYFTFFKFAITVMIVTFFLVSLSNIIYSKKYYDELYDLCNSEMKNKLSEKDCIFYKQELQKSDSYSLISDSFFFMFNSINTKYYRNLYYNLTSKTSNNKKHIEKIIINTSLMNFCCLITLFIFNIYFIIIINSKAQNINMAILSLSDYSIFLSHLTHVLKLFLKEKKDIEEKKTFAENTKTEYDYKEQLYSKLGIDESLIDSPELEQFKCFLKNKICLYEDGQKVNVNKINICFKISDLMKMQKQVQEIDEKMSKIRNHPYQGKRNEELNLYGKNRKYFSSFLNLKCCEKSESLIELEEEQNKIKEEIGKLMEQSKKNILDHFSGCAIICVDTIAEHEKFLKENPNNAYKYILKFLKYIFCKCLMNENLKDLYRLRRSVRIERAPEPEDIIFENLQCAYSVTRAFRTFLVYFFSIILIGFCFIIVSALNTLQKYIDEKNNFHIIVAYIISFLISIVIEIINLIFEKLLDFFTEKEKLSTTTNHYLSKSIKLTLFSFMNKGIIPLISDLYVESSGYEYLIINMFMIFLINSIFVPLSWTFSFSFIYKKIRIWLLERNIDPDDPDANHELTQKEINDLYEFPSMDIDEKYSYIYQTLLIAFFYIQIFPLGVPLSLIGFILGYFLEKYNFCNIYKKPEMLNDKLCQVYINYFIVCLFMSGIGDYIFKNDVYETKTWSLINIILFGILTIFPYNFIVDHVTRYFIDLKESKIHTAKLEDIYYSFYNNYEKANPMTKKEGLSNFLTGIKTLGIIKDSVYKENIENLQNANLMKLYYNERKNSNILKTQKTLYNNELKKAKANMLKKSILIKDIKDEDFEEDFCSPKEEPNIIKDLDNIVVSDIDNKKSDLINNKEKESLPINISSGRNFNNEK